MWQEFVEWLLQKIIETIVDFNGEIDTVYEISSDRKYIKTRIEETEITYKAQDVRYRQQRFKEIEERITEE